MNKPPDRKPAKIIYETEFHGKKLAIATETYNWIIIRCKPDEDPLESRQRWYFSDLTAMLKAVQKYFIKERIKRLETSEMIRVVEQSYQDVENLGQSLVEKIVAEAPYGALPRFPCDHVLLPQQREVKDLKIQQ
ncbi:hypothetical protein ACFL45_09585 [Candidatus Neomarinimicrobiota bacterium]